MPRSKNLKQRYQHRNKLITNAKIELSRMLLQIRLFAIEKLEADNPRLVDTLQPHLHTNHGKNQTH